MDVMRACLLACLVPLAAHAQMYKCVSKSGAVTYQADPCPEVDGAKLKAPPAGPVGPPKPAASSGLKEGWTPEEIQRMAESCVPGVIGPARKGFEASAKDAGNKLAVFPEDELTAPVKAMCTCFAKRVGSTYSLGEFLKDKQAILRKMNGEAMGGGACKPEGKLAEVMRP